MLDIIYIESHIHDMKGGRMAFREKMLWSSLVATLAIWGWYFMALLGALRADRVDFGQAAGRFVLAIVLIVAVQVVVAIALAITSPREANAPADDRERGFALSAYRAAFVVLSGQIVIVMLATPVIVPVALATLEGEPATIASVVLGNAMLFSVVIAELVHSGWQIVRYRLGG